MLVSNLDLIDFVKGGGGGGGGGCQTGCALCKCVGIVTSQRCRSVGRTDEVFEELQESCVFWSFLICKHRGKTNWMKCNMFPLNISSSA